MDMDVESTAKELKMLAARERLTATELDRAKDLMAQLKGMGMSNPEIVELTGGRWSESTTKGYTRGVRAGDPEPWQSTTATFSEMLSKNLTLADVSEAVSITAELEGMGSSLGDVVTFMQDLKRKGTNVDQLKEAVDIKSQLEQMGTSPAEITGFVKELEEEDIDISAFALLFQDWHEAGLTSAEARSALKYKAQLEDAGFNLETLPQIIDAAGKFGSPAQVIEAVSKYGALGDLDGQLQTKRKELDALSVQIETGNRELDIATKKLEGAQKQTADLRKALTTYRRSVVMGFDERALGELARAAGKYGTAHKVLRAINRFGDLSKIKAADDELTNKVKQKRAMVKSLEE